MTTSKFRKFNVADAAVLQIVLLPYRNEQVA